MHIVKCTSVLHMFYEASDLTQPEQCLDGRHSTEAAPRWQGGDAADGSPALFSQQDLPEGLPSAEAVR